MKLKVLGLSAKIFSILLYLDKNFFTYKIYLHQYKQYKLPNFKITLILFQIISASLYILIKSLSSKFTFNWMDR